MASSTIVAPSSAGGVTATTNGADRLPLELDTGLLFSVDPNPVDEDVFPSDPSTSTSALDEHILSRTQQATQTLLNAVFSLPVTRHKDHGPIVTLPPPLLILPREKPLPAPKPMTKWAQFAKAKGISKRKRDKMMFDDDTQEWVPRWGYKGANKKEEEQWLHPVKANADDDYSPARAAKRARKDRKLKNEGQRQRNLQRAAATNAAGPAAKPATSARGLTIKATNNKKKPTLRR